MPVVNCPNCRKPLRLPAGAQSIRCTTCNAVSSISNPTSFPPPRPFSSLPSPGPHSSYAPPPPPTGGPSPSVLSAAALGAWSEESHEETDPSKIPTIRNLRGQ
ncbi:Metacaspase-1 [Nymphaea thermarum]|nr:Metacaspase-1 [Nymphaea thermarum]